MNFVKDTAKEIRDAINKEQIEEVIIQVPIAIAKRLLKVFDWLTEWVEGWDFSESEIDKALREGNIPSDKMTKKLEAASKKNPMNKLEGEQTKNLPGHSDQKTNITKENLQQQAAALRQNIEESNGQKTVPFGISKSFLKKWKVVLIN